MNRRDVLRTTAATLGTGLAVGTFPADAHEGGSDGGGTVEGDASAGYGPLGVVDVPGAHEAVVDDSTAYVATGDGYAVVDVSDPSNPRVLARRTGLRGDAEDGPLVDVQDVKVDGDTLVVAAPAHPRRDALSGLVVVDISDPGTPRERSFFRTEYPVHNCDLADGRAYLTANDGDRNALVVVDVAGGAGDDPVEVGSWSLVDEDEAWRRVPGARRTLHDVTVHDGVAVCACWDAGTWLVDVADPSTPTVLGSVEAPDPTALDTDTRAAAVVPPGNHHYATLDGDLLAVGKETFAVPVDSDGDGERDRLVGGPSGVDLWDVSDFATPVKRSTVAPPTSDDPTFQGTWTTAHNLDLRDDVLYTSWYQGGVKRHDVSDPTNPTEESWWLAPTEASFWTARALPDADSSGRDDVFVASSRGVADVPGRLYVFPDRPGEQANPPSLGTPASATGQGGGDTSTASGQPPPEPTVSAPGFGFGAGVAALGLGGWWLRRRRR